MADKSPDSVQMFLGEEAAATYGRWMIAGGILLVMGAIVLFVACLMLPQALDPGPLVVQLIVTGPILAAIALIAVGRNQRACPFQVDLDEFGMAIHTAAGKRVIAWADVASVETGKRDTLMTGITLNTLRLLGNDRKQLVELDSQLKPFDELVTAVQRHVTATGTAALVDTTPRKRRRDAILLVVIGPLFLALAIFVGWDAQHEIRLQEAFRQQGKPAVARIVRHYKFHVTPRLEYAFEDPNGGKQARDTMVEEQVWRSLQEGGEVAIRYLPDEPTYNRLAVGDADDASDYDPRLMQLVAPLVGIMAVGFLVAGILMLCGIDVDGWLKRLTSHQSVKKPKHRS